MVDQIAWASFQAAVGNNGEPTPVRTWEIPENATVELGSRENAFDGMVITHWSVD